MGTASTIYVSGQGGVYAYDLTSLTSPAPSPGALVTPTPIAKAGGYYYQAGGLSASIAGIATSANGDLVVLQNYGNPFSPSSASCQLVYLPARTNAGPSAVTSSLNCSNDNGSVTGFGLGVAFSGYNGGTGIANNVDVLMHYTGGAGNNCAGNTSDEYEVDTYTATTGAGGIAEASGNCIALTGRRSFIAGGANGSIFVTEPSPSPGPLLEKYVFANSTPTNTTSSIPGPGPVAAAANPTTSVGYRAVASTTGGVTTIYTFKPNGSGGFDLLSALGSFNNPVAAIAIDNNGKLYVGVNQGGGVTKLKVYSPGKTEATSPDYVIANPVRRANPAASPAAIITGIAIAQ